MVTDYNIPERCICTCPLCVLFVVCPCDDCTIRSVNLYSFLFPFFQLLRSNDMTPANHEHEHPPPCRHCRCSRSRPYAFSKHPDKVHCHCLREGARHRRHGEPHEYRPQTFVVHHTVRYINDGVQGCSPTLCQHAAHLPRAWASPSESVDMQCAFSTKPPCTPFPSLTSPHSPTCSS
jgi:hypothetical protein